MVNAPRNLRHSLRLLAKNPGFTAVAVPICCAVAGPAAKSAAAIGSAIIFPS